MVSIPYPGHAMGDLPLQSYPNWYASAHGGDGVFIRRVPDDKVDAWYYPLMTMGRYMCDSCGRCGKHLSETGQAYMTPVYTSDHTGTQGAHFCTKECCEDWAGIEDYPDSSPYCSPVSKPYNTIKPCVTLGSPGRTSGQVPVSTAAQRSTEGGMNTST